MHWSGSIVFKQRGAINFLLDNDLSPDIAESLRLFDFDIIHFKEVPQFQNRTTGVEDPEIIGWCKGNHRAWITHDFKARRQHEAAMKEARIHVIWIRGRVEPIEKTGETATWRFYKMLVRVIDELQRILLASHGAMHFRISQKSKTRPEIDWAESDKDKPKRNI
jgi:predicted nuclease of predicted toxin-antitoxin system